MTLTFNQMALGLIILITIASAIHPYAIGLLIAGWFAYAYVFPWWKDRTQRLRD